MPEHAHTQHTCSYRCSVPTMIRDLTRDTSAALSRSSDTGVKFEAATISRTREDQRKQVMAVKCRNSGPSTRRFAVRMKENLGDPHL
ncbi:hypothetical protein MPTK1_7g12700 [Marchantia polymorpha subsp. ruderalis]|uniref:Uncharacterized protein n=2 Tax=Marchantia polymorpha TaxID=3197 RepID=A0AAF6BYW2_MARPO|nr:hypothetical protein MARPO_0003s0278 [Marchantia polymorpha]BBN17196.1 hypothetical protein Mp_7g12700 [Marchantia polymorpha subsp. ruderalis]|eukprot:PTQ49431.1 hypothetical protein MARPO_0003s0278 [Marchantia polymorpha]